jgi:hypothetical protein
MMCVVTDANTSDTTGSAPRNEDGVLANLPRTRPQRSSPRRAAARGAAAPERRARKPIKAETRAAKTAGGATAEPAGERTAGPGAGAARSKPAATAKRRTAAPRRRRAPLDEAAPRQGFECDGEAGGGSVQPPGSAELVASAAEIVGELAKAGVSRSERLLKDVLSRLPLS